MIGVETELGRNTMDTVKIERGTCRMIAHRGASALEAENTVAAFVAAANRSYWGLAYNCW